MLPDEDSGTIPGPGPACTGTQGVRQGGEVHAIARNPRKTIDRERGFTPRASGRARWKTCLLQGCGDLLPGCRGSHLHQAGRWIRGDDGIRIDLPDRRSHAAGTAATGHVIEMELQKGTQSVCLAWLDWMVDYVALLVQPMARSA